ncbi:MAG: amino acid adenylation domain-containing protein [Bacillota bacterium]|nr:amino acid adenylation domain-containing protein [Bacillota bacterium]
MKNVLEYIENSVVLHSGKTAVDDGEKSFNYMELMVEAMKIGSSLLKVLIENEDSDSINNTIDYGQRPIVIFADKSSMTLAAMLGVVYSGNFYVIINPEQPEERIKSIFQILQPMIVVTTEHDAAKITQCGNDFRVLFINELVKGEIDEVRLKQVRERTGSSDILYCVFTSGSTGKPKGIVTTHQAVLDVIDCFVDIFDITSRDIMANQAPFDFDVSVKDIYGALAAGASIVIIPKRYFASIGVLMDYLCSKNVTVLVWAVSALCLVSSMKGLEYRKPENIRMIMFSGEVMPDKELQKWMKAFPDVTYVNLYGPTEITCHCTYHMFKKDNKPEIGMPLGEAFPGRQVFLVDDEMRLITESGKKGEIFVSGNSLARGYYNMPELTEESFIEYRIDERNFGRTYRTGDIGYYGDDGMLRFSGRKDFQIKVMGHRIEIEEIELAVSSLEEVSRCCCVINKKGKLCAYFTGDIEPQELHMRLKALLPDYMIPAKQIRVRDMPMNKNGKIDRKYFANV